MSIVKVDIDVPVEEFNVEDFIKRASFISDILGVDLGPIAVLESQGGNVHIVARAPEVLPSWVIVAIQFALGSDWYREVYNVRRLMRGQENWNILFDHELVEYYIRTSTPKVINDE